MLYDAASFMIMIVLALAVSSVSVTITLSKIFKAFRTRVAQRSPFFGDLVSCPYCFSHWGSLLAVLLFQVHPVLTGAWLLDYLIATFAMVTMASMYSGLIIHAYGSHR